MSALFGFSGSFDPKLFQSMRSTLAHRGRTISHVSNDHATIAICTNSPDADSKSGAGVESFKQSAEASGRPDDGLIALSGFQTAGNSKQTLELRSIADSIIHSKNPPDELSGDFVAAVSVRDHLYLVRDGSGCRTVYYAVMGHRLIFASEPKAIWSLPGFQRILNSNSLLKYLTFSFVPETPTMLSGLAELPAGHSLAYSNGELKTHRYFEFEKPRVDLFDRPQNETESFHQVFSASVSDRLEFAKSDPTLFLSGGLDSSVVAAEIRRQKTGRIATFSLHFGHKYPNELEFANLVAQRLNTDHQEVLIQPKDFLPNLRQMIWHLDDPIGDPITMPNYMLAERVSQETDFVFNGEGGDPCLGGPKNLPMMLTHWYGVHRDPDFRELAYLESFRRAYEEIDRIFDPAFERTIQKHCLVETVKPFFTCKHPNTLLEKLQAINIRLKGAHLILPKVERMLAAHGVAPLSPLFSSEIVRKSFEIDPRMKLDRGTEKVVLKQIYRRDLPTLIIDRPKSGMRVPVHFWFQGELKKYAKHVLSKKEIKRAGIFNPARVKQLLDYNIEEGNGRYGMRLWMLLTFEIWRRIVLEGEPV